MFPSSRFYSLHDRLHEKSLYTFNTEISVELFQAIIEKLQSDFKNFM